MIDKKVDYVEEKPLPGGWWERTYHGKAMQSEECVKAMNTESDDAKQHLATGGFDRKVQGKDGRAVVGNDEYMDHMASAGALDVVFQAWSGFGPGQRLRCSVCGRERVKLRSIESGPLFCLKGSCEDVVRETNGHLAHRAG